MKKHLFVALAALGLAGTLYVGASFAQDGKAPPPRPGAPPPGAMPPGMQPRPGGGLPPGMGPRPGAPPAGANPHAAPPAGHGPSAGHGAPAAAGHGDGHGDGHGPGHINWIHGLIAARADVTEPSLLWRPKGMPAPFAANLINFALFAYVIVRLGKKPIMDGLQKRRDDLMREIDEAAKIRDEAEERLAEYEEKLDNLESEAERVQKDYEEQAKRDEARILAEAKDRRTKMKKDAELTVTQEGRELEAQLLAETIARATSQAEALLRSRVGAADHERLADELLGDLGKVASLGGAR